MQPTQQQIKAYLKAIGFKGKLDNSFETLKKIVEGHAFTFPYETLNVHDGELDLHPNRRSNLKISALFNKLVKEHRGGRCVELNTFLQAMLGAIGFNVKPILPDTLWHEANTPKHQRPKHTAAIVSAQGKDYLVDAAFGGLGIFSPLPLVKGTYQQFSEKFKLTSSKDYPFELQIWREDKWISIYGFDKSLAAKSAYEKVDTNNRNPLNFTSYFKNIFICTKPFKMDNDKNGRYRIFNGQFIVYENGQIVRERKITSLNDLHHILQTKFGIDLKDHHIRYRELDMDAFQEGIRRPPVLHRYETRLKEKYLALAEKHHEVLQPCTPKKR